eukprot:357281-Prymnesium_polylepis.1
MVTQLRPRWPMVRSMVSMSERASAGMMSIFATTMPMLERTSSDAQSGLRGREAGYTQGHEPRAKQSWRRFSVVLHRWWAFASGASGAAAHPLESALPRRSRLIGTAVSPSVEMPRAKKPKGADEAGQAVPAGRRSPYVPPHSR